MSQDQKHLQRFRRVAIPEGISFLVLLFLAMPLKYGLGIEWPVKVVGWAHGILFIAYCILALRCWYEYRWPFRFAFLAFVASLFPFGPFVIDRRLPGVSGLDSKNSADESGIPSTAAGAASSGRA